MSAPAGKCTAPMWMGGCPAGYCGKPAWGRYIPGETFRDAWTGQVSRRDGKFHGFVPGLACQDHGGPDENAPRVEVDGTDEAGREMWFAFYPDFVNLQESPAEFHVKPWVAIAMLLKNHPHEVTA